MVFVRVRCWGGRGRDPTWFVFDFMSVIRLAFYFMSSGLSRVLSTHVAVTLTPLRGDWIRDLRLMVIFGGVVCWWSWCLSYFDGGVDVCCWIW